MEGRDGTTWVGKKDREREGFIGVLASTGAKDNEHVYSIEE